MEYWPGMHSLDFSRISNVYLFMGPPVTLIDTGPPGSLERLLLALEQRGVRPTDLQRIILTHCDVDHVGNAHALRLMSGAEVYAHEADVAAIDGSGSLPGPLLRACIGATMGRRVSSTHVDRPVHDEETLDGLTVVHLPGHTPGHIGLRYERVLFAGDCVFGGRRLRPSPAILTWSKKAERRSLERIAALEIDLILPGHGSGVNDGSRRCRELAAGLS